MTPRERAKQLCEPDGIITTANGYTAAAISAIEYAIKAAVEEEREACRRIAAEVKVDRRLLGQMEGAFAAEIIESNIRDRKGATNGQP